MRRFGCPRSKNAHIERKKCECDYILEQCPTDAQIAEIEAEINRMIAASLPVTIEFMSKDEAAAIVDLSKLPKDASDTLRIVRIGDYDACACIGAHVSTGIRDRGVQDHEGTVQVLRACPSYPRVSKASSLAC